MQLLGVTLLQGGTDAPRVSLPICEGHSAVVLVFQTPPPSLKSITGKCLFVKLWSSTDDAERVIGELSRMVLESQANLGPLSTHISFMILD